MGKWNVNLVMEEEREITMCLIIEMKTVAAMLLLLASLVGASFSMNLAFDG